LEILGQMLGNKKAMTKTEKGHGNAVYVAEMNPTNSLYANSSR